MKSKRLVQIGENHERGISVTLYLLDQALCEFEQWAQGRQVRSVLYEVRNTLSVEQRRRILDEIAHMRQILVEIRDALALEGNIKSVVRVITAQCAVLWVHLVELEGKRLLRYGEPPLELANYLDPKVGDLIERLKNIADIVSGEPLDK